MNSIISIQHPIYGTANPNITAAGTVRIFKAPAAAFGGGVNIREAQLSLTSGTATFTLVDLGTTGTVAVGTVCTLAASQATSAPVTGTPNQYFLQAGRYLGVVYPAGTIVPPAAINVLAAFGRGTA